MCYWVYLSKVFLCTWQQSSKLYSFVFHRRFKYYGYHIYGVVRSFQKQLFGRKKNCVSPFDFLLHYCMITKPLSGVKAPSILIEIDFWKKESRLVLQKGMSDRYYFSCEIPKLCLSFEKFWGSKPMPTTFLKNSAL